MNPNLDDYPKHMTGSYRITYLANLKRRKGPGITFKDVKLLTKEEIKTIIKGAKA